MIELPLTQEMGLLLWGNMMSRIYRYSGEQGLPMIHRTNLFTHATRVLHLADHLMEVLESIDENGKFPLDKLKVRQMAYRHDDPELLTNDILTIVKMRMSPDEKAALGQKELDVTPWIAKFIFGFKDPLLSQYVSNQRELHQKESTEAQIVDVADKWEALEEKTHEIRCGNDQVFAPTIDISKKQFEKFEAYPFWTKIREHPTLDLKVIPTAEHLSSLPKLTMEKVRDMGKENLPWALADNIDQWPTSYETWLALSIKAFYHNPEKHLLQGWCLRLWERWGIPKGTVTDSGIILG